MLKLTPHLTNYLWGGIRLKQEFNYQTAFDKVAEAWVVSSRADGPSWTEDNKKFSEIVGEDFPLLVKFIDAKDNLSIQVHPADKINGKTEMWYVLDAVKDAKIAYGWNQTMTAELVEEAINSENLEQYINYEPVKKGDAIFVPAGTVHGIGAGILIAEVQQNSNSTYRLYDYNRKDSFGKSRELHVTSALKVLKFDKQDPLSQNLKVEKCEQSAIKQLSSCEFFSVYEVSLAGSIKILAQKFQVLLVLENTMIDGTQRCKGDSFYVKPGTEYVISGMGMVLIGQVQSEIQIYEEDQKCINRYFDANTDVK
ncbi:Mannose-6-phosphate isomerase, class I [Spironucleus salmonicida]|uniref:Mannose-6-phosphate isomerase, class I n=1 Tax=Spironucleus salmonicida TaxID=348837 RepID=V6LEB7_9EUKA|nr:Mannose-6-phosphate isomerase, class I [Spironucleus salmonicida]|eukprot:EST42850.1 Mannose-6-phosphate isomerase, class I [Spironucleus salmonicida]